MKNYNYPDVRGYFGEFGGRFVPETLVGEVKRLKEFYDEMKEDGGFKKEVEYYFKEYVGRESPLTFCANLTKKFDGVKFYLKREDLNHTGSHKINNAIGQALLCKRMGKNKIVAETGAGQHGVAAATAAALLNLECIVFMGEVDVERQKLNVFRMKLLGAKVVSVSKGNGTLKDAVNEALKYWTEHCNDTHYLIGSALGPHPFPEMVRDFQSVIGKETKKQIMDKEGRLPDAIVSCVGGGSNAIGMFYPFIEDTGVRLYGAEAGGLGVKTGEHAATLTEGTKGILHGAKMYLLQDENGQVKEPYSISAGLDYPGVGPEHCMLRDTKRAIYEPINDDEALEAFQVLSREEGIIPAIESAHAVALAFKIAKKMKKDEIIVINLSGRGDKDVERIGVILGDKYN